MIASNPQPIPHCAMRMHVKQCLLQLCRRSLVSGGLRYLISAPFLYFGSRFHGLRQSPGPLQTCKEQQVYSPHHLRTRPTQTEFIKRNLNWVLWSFSCSTPAASPQNQAPATQPLTPVPTVAPPLSVPHRASTEAVDRSDLPAALLPGGIAK